MKKYILFLISFLLYFSLSTVNASSGLGTVNVNLGSTNSISAPDSIGNKNEGDTVSWGVLKSYYEKDQDGITKDVSLRDNSLFQVIVLSKDDVQVSSRTCGIPKMKNSTAPNLLVFLDSSVGNVSDFGNIFNCTKNNIYTGRPELTKNIIYIGEGSTPLKLNTNLVYNFSLLGTRTNLSVSGNLYIYDNLDSKMGIDIALSKNTYTNPVFIFLNGNYNFSNFGSYPGDESYEGVSFNYKNSLIRGDYRSGLYNTEPYNRGYLNSIKVYNSILFNYKFSSNITDRKNSIFIGGGTDYSSLQIDSGTNNYISNYNKVFLNNLQNSLLFNNGGNNGGIFLEQGNSNNYIYNNAEIFIYNYNVSNNVFVGKTLFYFINKSYKYYLYRDTLGAFSSGSWISNYGNEPKTTNFINSVNKGMILGQLDSNLAASYGYPTFSDVVGAQDVGVRNVPYFKDSDTYGMVPIGNINFDNLLKKFSSPTLTH